MSRPSPPRRSVHKLHVHRWSKSVACNMMSLCLAQRLAVGAETAYQFIRQAREKRLDAALPGMPQPSAWCRLYRDHGAINDALDEPVSDDPSEPVGAGGATQCLLDQTRWLSTQARTNSASWRGLLQEPASRAALLRGIRLGQRMWPRVYKRHLRELRADLRRPGWEAEDNDKFGEALAASPAVFFYFRVVLVSLLVYQQTPIALLRRARSGDAVGVERLVRVDPLAMHLPAVHRWVEGVGGRQRLDRSEMVRRWQAQGVDEKQFSRAQVKKMIGGLILAYIRVHGSYVIFPLPKRHPPQVTAAQVRELFDAVAKDRPPRNPRPSRGVYDEDLADLQVETWCSQIRPYRRAWEQILTGRGGWNLP